MLFRSIPLRVRTTDDYGWVDSSLLLVVNAGTTPWLRYPEYSELGTGTRFTVRPAASAIAGARYRITGALPPGMTFDRATGVISGRPRVADGRVYEPTITAVTASGATLADSWATIKVIKPAVPMRVTARPAGRKLATSRTVVVSAVKHPTWATTSASVRCSGCRWTFSKRTGRVTITKAVPHSRVRVVITVTPTRASASQYAGHIWSRQWKTGARR